MSGKNMLKGDPPPIRILLVEGQDDRHFVQQLWDKHCAEKPPFSISDKGGVGSLIEAIRLEIKDSGREALGILADANGDIAQKWQEITDEIKKERGHLNLKSDQIPRKSKPAGTIIDCKPRIGIWLMPDNKSPGELEDFAAKMVPKNDSVWPLSEEYIENIPKNERKFAPDKTPKAKLFAWLAARKEPGRMGAAVGAGDLTLNNEPSRKFLKWLSELFR